MKPGSKRRSLAGILAVAALAPGCAASLAHRAAEIACTTVPIASAPTGGTGGQSSRLDMPPVPGSLGAVAARSPSSAVAVGWTGATQQRAMIALWNGAVWKTLSSPVPPPGSELSRVALFPGGAWAVGEQRIIENGRYFFPLIMRVTGTTVRQVPLPRTTYGGAPSDVAAISAVDAWAVGNEATIGGSIGPALILHWDGTAWTRAPLPATVRSGLLTGVAATSRTNAWAVIDPEGGWGRPRIVHWNGRQWGDVVSPAIGMSYRLNGVAATSARNAWAVGSTGSRAVILHWNGRTWTCALSLQIHPPQFPGTSLSAVSASSADNAWAVGSYFDSAHRALALHWDGHIWTQVMTPQPGQDNWLLDVAVIPQSGGAWAVGNAENATYATLMLHWNGAAWR